jgi:hypothetical protein
MFEAGITVIKYHRFMPGEPPGTESEFGLESDTEGEARGRASKVPTRTMKFLARWTKEMKTEPWLKYFN